jgi:predicted helicase
MPDAQPQVLSLKPTHKAVLAFYSALATFKKLGVKHEGAVASAFEDLLEHSARQVGRALIPKYTLKLKAGKSVVPDAAIVDSLSRVLCYGLWEAKDTDDDLDKEIKAKFQAGYPRDNTLFQDPGRAVLYQNGTKLFDGDLKDPVELIHVLNLFFGWRPPAFEVWETAIEEFKDRVPELGSSLAKLVRGERQSNARYRAAFEDFLRLCRASLNPNLSDSAVEEMIVQHVLTERIFRKIFDIGDFMQRNIIAREIEKVIGALTSRKFSRDEFSTSLEHFYVAIEQAAETITDFTEKQKFLNTVYEQFFQGFSVKVADTHGIVYTPQPLVDFMVASVEHVLVDQFSSSLRAKNVHILDPFTGTGNFVVNIMRHVPVSALPRKFSEELYCNEVMLLPYYVASMNIEHAFWEATGLYEAFPGVCLVDTFETAEGAQPEFEMFSEANSERVERQRKAPIKVIIANPPYNAGQINENDNNKNRKYPTIDKRVRDTYSADSEARLVRKLSDPYVKAIRYASDRIGEAGIVCFVNNDSFIEERTFDGMRKHLVNDFDMIYVLQLGGNVRKHPELSGTTHNVFGIQVGVSINLFIRVAGAEKGARNGRILHHAVPVDWRRGQKYDFLASTQSIQGIKFRVLKPDTKHNWLTNKRDAEFDEFLPLGIGRGTRSEGVATVFRSYSLGVSTNRDSVVYDFETTRLAGRTEDFADAYNVEVGRWKKQLQRWKSEKDSILNDRRALKGRVDQFVNYERVKWSETLKRHLLQGDEATFDAKRIRQSLYRPFTVMALYDAPMFVDRPGRFAEFLPTAASREENVMLMVPSAGARSPFWCFAANMAPNLNFVSIDSCQCFPLYVYDTDGSHRGNNIPTLTLTAFRDRYADKEITRHDVFHYVYALLHHAGYRSRFGENLRRDLPRIPLVGKVKDFRAFVAAGKKLIDLHVAYEDQKEYPLKRKETPGAKLDWRVEAMKLNRDQDAIVYNEFVTLAGVPPKVFGYNLGNRSALEWVIDQYRVSRDDQGEIVEDPNRPNDETYIIRLVGKVITVSLQTLEICAALPEVDFDAEAAES